jgi:hypothetical protein
MHQKSVFAVGACRSCSLPLVTGQLDQQVVPRGHSLHTNFPAVELSPAQIGRLACDRMFPFVGYEVLGGLGAEFSAGLNNAHLPWLDAGWA